MRALPIVKHEVNTMMNFNICKSQGKIVASSTLCLLESAYAIGRSQRHLVGVRCILYIVGGIIQRYKVHSKYIRKFLQVCKEVI
jgi:hypothetical protein